METYKPKLSLKLLIWVFGVVTVAAQVFFTIHISANGSRRVALEKRKHDLEKQVRELSQDLVLGSSLTKIEEKADKLGFTKPEKIIYLGLQESVAQLH